MLIGRPRYDQIRDLYASHLASAWMEDQNKTTRASFDKKIDSFTEGELEHAVEILSTLWEIINKPGGITAPSNSPPAGSVSAFPFSVLHKGAHSTPQVRLCGHESCRLGSCEDHPHQVDPRRGFLRQEILGCMLQGWECSTARLLFKHSHGRQTAAIGGLYVVIRL